MKRIIAIILTLALSFSLFGCVPGLVTPLSESVSEEHFSSFGIAEVSTPAGKSARVSVLTDISLISYDANISLLGKDGKVLIEHDSSANEIISAGSTFSVFIPLGDVSYADIKEVSIHCTGKTYDISGEYLSEPLTRVTFKCDNMSWAQKSAKSGEPIPCPDTPTLDGKIFGGWYQDAACTVPFDFAKGVSNDCIVYAKLTRDTSDVINRVTKELMPSVVRITSTYTEDLIWNTTKMTSTSSGVIIRHADTSYILTNAHCVTLLSGYNRLDITVTDCFGKEYSEHISIVARDPAYDLAILAVGGLSDELCAIEMATANPEAGDEVISLGAPASQANAITLGKVKEYCNVKLETEEYLSNVEFGVISHTAEVRRGSSGGALINEELLLVGINFAGKGGDDFAHGFAIPIEKVHEFIDKHM